MYKIMKAKIFCLSLSFSLTLLNISHAGDFPRCEELANGYFKSSTNGNEEQINDKDLSLCRTACKANDIYGCFVVLHKDPYPELDSDALQGKICNLSNSNFPNTKLMGYICFASGLGIALNHNEVKQNLDLAKTFIEKACNTFNDSRSCEFMGQLEETLNKDIAKKYYEKACSLDGISGCYGLGKLYFSSDKQQARKYLEKSCAKEQPLGCLLLEELNRQ